MGLGNNTGRFTYVNIKKGRLAIKRENETDFFDYIEGTLTGLEIRDEEYQGEKYKKLCLMLVDNDQNFQLQMRLDSGYGRAFCNIIQNADVAQRLKFSPTFEESDGKQKSGMFINQNGKALKWYYTKDNPRDLPPMEEVFFKNQKHWDNSKQQAFYIDLLLNKVRPQLSGAASIIDGPKTGFERNDIPEASSITQPIDDLPF